jgi:hypothetical protein
MTMTPVTAEATDPHGLLGSGDALATEPELARILGVSRNVLHEMLHGPLHGLVRFVRYVKAPRRYCIADAQTAIEPHREAIEGRRREAEGREAAERAAAAARRADRIADAEARVRTKPGRSPTTSRVAAPKREPPRPSVRPGGPEVLVRRGPRA